MMRLLAVLAVTTSALAVAGGPDVAAAEPATCAGHAVTIDLNQPDAPDPMRADSDVVLGTPDHDRIQTGGGADIVCAGAGDDTIELGGGAPEGVREEAYGEDGNDSYAATSADELFDEGSGGGYVSYSHCCDEEGVTVDLTLSGPQDTRGGGLDELVGIVSVIGSPGDDVLYGDDGPNLLGGQSGDDVLVGRDGNDYLDDFSFGDDVLTGGRGDDHMTGGDDSDTFTGGPGDDYISTGGFAGPAGEVVHAGAGRDFILGSRSNEVLDGGRGRDTVQFGVNCRECSGGDPGAYDAVRVDLRLTGPQDTEGSGVDQLTGVENLIGTGERDVLLGNGERNRLDGFVGNDVLKGRRGADDLIGGGGRRDTCVGGPGHDVLTFCER